MFEVDGRKFQLSVDGDRIACRPDDRSDEVLCNAVLAGWQADAARLLTAVRDGHGLGLEGNAGFTYYDEAASEFPTTDPDVVMVDYLDEEQFLPRRTFERFVGQFARASIRAGAPSAADDRIATLGEAILARHP